MKPKDKRKEKIIIIHPEPHGSGFGGKAVPAGEDRVCMKWGEYRQRIAQPW